MYLYLTGFWTIVNFLISADNKISYGFLIGIKMLAKYVAMYVAILSTC